MGQENTIKLYTVSAALEERKAESNTTPYHGLFKETDKSYVGGGYRIDKNRVMDIVAESRSFGYICYETICLEHQIPEAKKAVTDALIKEFSRRKQVMEQMTINLIKLI